MLSRLVPRNMASSPLDTAIMKTTTLGLLCGSGTVGSIDISGITCEALEPADEYTDPITLTVEGNRVSITVVTEE